MIIIGNTVTFILIDIQKTMLQEVRKKMYRIGNTRKNENQMDYNIIKIR